MSWSIAKFVTRSGAAAKAEVQKQYDAVKEHGYFPEQAKDIVLAAIDEACPPGDLPEGLGVTVEAFGHRSSSGGNIKVEVQNILVR